MAGKNGDRQREKQSGQFTIVVDTAKMPASKCKISSLK